jgi:hypothetical protein
MCFGVSQEKITPNQRKEVIFRVKNSLLAVESLGLIQHRKRLWLEIRSF